MSDKDFPSSSFQVYFGSGSFVRVDVFEWGLNVLVHSPSVDPSSVLGLCGLEVGEASDAPTPPTVTPEDNLR